MTPTPDEAQVIADRMVHLAPLEVPDQEERRVRRSDAVHLTRAERSAHGKDARAEVSLQAHAMLAPSEFSPERNLVFDLNDFDETLPGPFEWDVKRLAASLEVAGRDNGFKRTARSEVVLSAVRSYRESIRAFAGQTNLEVWYARLDMERELARILPLLRQDRARRTEQLLAKARTRSNLRTFEKLTTLVDGEPHIISDPPLVVPVTELFPAEDAAHLFAQLRRLLASYVRTLPSDRRHLVKQFRMVDMARQVVGVGSGWQRTTSVDRIERDYYVRQLCDWKGSVLPEEMVPQGMAVYAGMCGWTLARAHARYGDRIAIASYLGKKDTFDQAIAEFASAYADRNELDHASLRNAVAAGRVAAVTGT